LLAAGGSREASAGTSGGSGGGVGERDLEWELHVGVRPVLVGLLRVGRLAEAIDTFQVSLIREMIEVLGADTAEALAGAEAAGRSPAAAAAVAAAASTASAVAPAPGAAARVGGSLVVAGGGGGGGSADVSERLQALPPAAFLDVVVSMSRAAAGMLQRVGALHDLIERTLDAQGGAGAGAAASASASASATATTAAAAASASSSSSSSSSGSSEGSGLVAVSAAAHAAQAAQAAGRSMEQHVEKQRLRALSSGQVAVAVDTAQRRLAALLSARREQSARMCVADLRQLWDATAAFNSAAAAVLAHAGAGLGLGGGPRRGRAGGGGGGGR
jgi:hypothetical protein